MRKLFSIIFTTNSFFALGQSDKPNIDTTRRDENGKMIISSIIKAKDSLFKYVIFKNYGSGDAVINYENKEEGKVYCRAKTSKLVYMNTFVKMDGGRFSYELTALCKTGRVKISLTNITHEKGDMIQMSDGSDFGDSFPSKWGKLNRRQSEKEWVKMKNQAFIEFQSIINLFYEAIMKVSDKKDDNF